ncbi:MAG: IS66 family transposase [Gammaproteobacteria bacterium]|nr:IS66 family transposase [Gammaproteobacteria bacterium]MBQ0839325.1 IS66 family transposase [Gammaproteobacteria bacterium]
MPSALKSLPDDPAKLKTLLIKERSASEKREDQLKQQIHALLEALRLEKHRLYGKSSEKCPDQSELFDEADSLVDELEGVDEEPAPATPAKKTQRPVRKPLPVGLPRVRRVIELGEADRQCACGCTLVEIGEDISEQVDIIPARVQVIQHVRKKYACKACDETLKIAPTADVLLPKALASANTMAYVITSKYADGLPLYRLSGILSRYGIELSRQTLSESVLKVAEKLMPLTEHLKQQLINSSVLFMDETRVQVLNEPGKTPESYSYMWVQRGGPPGKPIVQFHYDPGRSTDTAKRLLNGFAGTLMSDGYKPYRAVAKDNGLTHLCCWAHSRRKFIEAQKAQPKGKTGKADVAVNFIGKLYGVERQTKDSDGATRHRTRQQIGVPVLNQFHTWLLKSQQQVPPKTALGKAVNYTLEYWSELSRYTDNSAWPIDNNPAENAIRPFVIGRKNWLFSSSQRGAKASASLYSLIETAKANGKEPYHYLSWLFEKLPGADNENIEALMPWNR